MQTWRALGCASLLMMMVQARAQAAPKTAAPDARAAEDLAYEAIACWLGPVWGDAIGEPVEQRKANTEARCKDVVARTWGARDSKGDLERLRALEANAVADLLHRVDALAQGSAGRADLVSLLRLTAGAMRDNMWARRAADKIKLDEKSARPHDRLLDDERAAADPLLKSESVRALLQAKAGAFGGDAHALGIFAAMDRINAAGGLPRHVEIYAAGPAFRLLFDVAPPDVPSDPGKPVAPHVWLDYLARVAAAAGHPLPDTAARGEERDRLAWAGMLDGVADRLEQTSGVSTRLRPVVDGTVRRLRAEAIGDRNWFTEEQRRRAELRSDLSGKKERGMENCPSAVTGAHTRAVPLKDGVALEVTSSDPAQAAEIRARAQRQTAVARHATGRPPHTGMAGDTGAIGYCPVVVTDTVVSAEDLPNGARLIVRTKKQADVPALQRTTEERIDALRRTGP